MSLLAGLAWACAALLAAGPMPARAAEDAFPRPPALERDVHFWVRVYSEINTNSGFLHDENNLAVVYDTLHFDPGATPRQRERQVDAAKDRYVAALKRIAASTGPLSAEDQRIRDLWSDEGTPSRLREATDHIRFQLGQSDRFRAGLSRSGQWETHIAEALANLGLPAELAVLPHVESSFNPAAYSKVGAAGLWQFMRSTGRRYMRIDSSVDDRMDPFRATEAAAQLLAYNYRLLGTWPLALTAYNHGAAGMRRAKDQLGTDDIAQIVRHYRSPTFGFASRNFYVSFLAALEIDRNPDKYFGSIDRVQEAHFQEFKLPAKTSITTLAHSLKIDADELKQLNPALRPTIWRGKRPVPSGYRLRLPLDDEQWKPQLVARRLGVPGSALVAQQVPDRRRLVAGTPVRVAARTDEGGAVAGASASAPAVGAQPSDLVASLNGAAGAAAAAASGKPGTLPIPATGPGSASVGLPGSAASATEASGSALGDHQPLPVGGADAADQSGGATEPTAALEEPRLYVVQREESLADIAAKVGVSESRLLAINHLPDADYLYEGQQLLLAENSPGAELEAPGAQVASIREPTAAGGVPAEVAQRESAEDAAAVAEVQKPATQEQPVSAAQEEELGPALGPSAVATTDSTDPNDYSVAKEDTIVVAAAETLGHYADWLHVSAARLRTLNHLKHGRTVLMGHRIKLDFSRVSREKFENKRQAYHRDLEASYFAAHRITGTEVYIARPGDSLWSVTQRFEHLPVWLLQQYNPDVDFGAMRAGMQLVVPRVADADVESAGG